EREARSDLLLERQIQQPVGRRVEQPRLAVRADRLVFRQAAARRRLVQRHAEAAEHTDRLGLAEQVAARVLHEAARRDLQPRRAGAAIFFLRDLQQPPLAAEAVADRRRRRLLDGDEQVAARFVAVPQLVDAGAAEQAEAEQPPLRVVDLREAEGIARLNLQLALDRARGRAH